VRDNSSTFYADFFGGLAGAIAVLPQTIGLSVLLFTSIGLDASSGAMAGLIGATILLLSSGIMGATTGMISAPNGPVTMLLAGLVVKLSPDYSHMEVLVILGAVLFFTGLFQITFGLLKGGEVIKIIPYPVVASMITAIGILMIKSQFKQIIPVETIDGWSRYIPLIVAIVTFAIIYIFKTCAPKLPSILMGLLGGIATYAMLTFSTSSRVDPNWVIGTLPVINVEAIFHRFDGLHLFQLPWQLIIVSALALTVLVMIDCLLTALVADTQTFMRHNAKKELVAQGIAQMLIGIVGGVGGGGTKGSTLACTMAGGRRWSPVFAALILILISIFGREVGAFLPLSALSGVIIYIGLKMINPNILLWFTGRYTRLDAINAIMVIVVTLFFDVTKAVALGMIFAIITFISRNMQRSLIRRQTNITEYPSPRRWSEQHGQILKGHGDKALLIELQGSLYFARTDQLYTRIMEEAQGRQVIILHFRRVSSIDMSGMVILMQMVEMARKNGTEIVFTHLHKRLGFGKKAKKAFASIERNKEWSHIIIFKSTVRALEYAEDQILKSQNIDIESKRDIAYSVEFENNELCTTIDTTGISLLKEIAVKKRYNNKEVVLSEGDSGTSIYMVKKGCVERRLYNGRTSYKVLAKYSPGIYFGKPSFFGLGPITTRYVAQGETTLYKLRKAEIEQVSEKMKAGLYADFLFSISRNIAYESEKLISEIQRLEAL